MRILIIYPVFPWPLDTGTRVRVYNQIKALAAQGHEVGLVSFYEGDGDPIAAGAGELLSWLSEVRIVRIGVPHGVGWRLRRLARVLPFLCRGVPKAAAFAAHAEIEAAIDGLVDNYDAVLVGFYFMGFSISRPVWRRAREKLFLVEDDLSFIPLARKAAVARGLEKAVRLFQAAGGKRAETSMLGRFKNVFVMSETDAKIAAGLAPETCIRLSPNGVDCAGIPFHPRPEWLQKPLSLLFVGGLAHYPNLDALRYFIGEHWPEIRRRLPGTTLTVVGAPGGIDTGPLLAGGVRFAGFVPDLNAMYAEADATVTPFRIGGGTRLKILEAMSAGLPTVSTAVGIEGIPAVAERDYLPAESGEDYVRALERLLQEPGLAAKLAENGRRLVETNFDWPILTARLARCLDPTGAAEDCLPGQG